MLLCTRASYFDDFEYLYSNLITLSGETVVLFCGTGLPNLRSFRFIHRKEDTGVSCWVGGKKSYGESTTRQKHGHKGSTDPARRLQLDLFS